MAGTSEDDASRVPRGRADSPASSRDEVVGGPLFTGVATVCETAARLSGSDGAALAVFAPSRSRELVYATDALAQELDDLQSTLGEGPCLDAYRTRSSQLCPQLDTDVQFNRRPAFCYGTAELGARAVFAFPVLAAHRALGVLELYRRTAGEMDAGQRESAHFDG